MVSDQKAPFDPLPHLSLQLPDSVMVAKQPAATAALVHSLSTHSTRLGLAPCFEDAVVRCALPVIWLGVSRAVRLMLQRAAPL